jgi:four helix bundle protein
MRNFKDLTVWQTAHAMTLTIYEATRSFPKEELYGLTSQLRSSSASIGANIAEGSGRRSDAEICRFLRIARGSASEVEYHLLLAHDLHLLNDAQYRDLTHQADRVQRMLTALIQKLTAVEPGAQTTRAS